MTADEFSRVGYEAVERLCRMENAVQSGNVRLIADDGNRGVYAAHILRQAIDSVNMLRASTKP